MTQRERGRGWRQSSDDVGATPGKPRPGDDTRPAMDEIAKPATREVPAVASRPPDRDPITDLPPQHTVAQRIDVAGDLMARGHRENQTRLMAGHKLRVCVAHTARLHRDPDLPGIRIFKGAVHQGELPS